YVCFFQKYGYTHLSAGELLRDERKNPDSQYGELIEKYIKEGKIVPVEITISLLKREMDQTMAANAQKNKFLIDGFPRNQDNLQGWNKTMDGKADVSFVLFFDCNNEICIERCLERGKSSGRSDDNRESLEKRIQTYLQSTKPIIDLYEEMGKVKKIDASKSVDEVSPTKVSSPPNYLLPIQESITSVLTARPELPLFPWLCFYEAYAALHLPGGHRDLTIFPPPRGYLRPRQSPCLGLRRVTREGERMCTSVVHVSLLTPAGLSSLTRSQGFRLWGEVVGLDDEASRQSWVHSMDTKPALAELEPLKRAACNRSAVARDKLRFKPVPLSSSFLIVLIRSWKNPTAIPRSPPTLPPNCSGLQEGDGRVVEQMQKEAGHDQRRCNPDPQRLGLSAFWRLQQAWVLEPKASGKGSRFSRRERRTHAGSQALLQDAEKAEPAGGRSRAGHIRLSHPGDALLSSGSPFASKVAGLSGCHF
ncbi:PREDICTED: UMP-CMP kinase, partial [Mandrillus leucophaeus]|uniref:UMP-CMP kinase n=1 Tax=Mandrillus leucophaeus TaxID=9568 RepID=UPI0005F40805